MRLIFAAITMLSAVFLASCAKEDDKDKKNPYGEENGQLTFYTDYGGDRIIIYLEGERIGRLDSMVNATPDCNKEEYAARHIRHWGRYPFEAISGDGIRHWKGELVVKEGKCTSVSLSDTSQFLIGGQNAICRVKSGADSLQAMVTDQQYIDCHLFAAYHGIKVLHNNYELVNGDDVLDDDFLLKLRKGRNVLNFKFDPRIPTSSTVILNVTCSTSAPYQKVSSHPYMKTGYEGQMIIIRK